MEFGASQKRATRRRADLYGASQQELNEVKARMPRFAAEVDGVIRGASGQFQFTKAIKGISATTRRRGELQ